MSADGRLIIREEEEDDAATAKTEEEEGTKGGTIVHSRDTALAWAGLHSLVRSFTPCSFTHSFSARLLGSVGSNR